MTRGWLLFGVGSVVLGAVAAGWPVHMMTWAPDGDRFAFILTAADGEQLWLATIMEGMLFEAMRIMTVPSYIYREVEFSSDGELIAAHRSRIDVPHPEPEVVVLEVAGREQEVIASASTPRWLQ